MKEFIKKLTYSLTLAIGSLLLAHGIVIESYIFIFIGGFMLAYFAVNTYEKINK